MSQTKVEVLPSAGSDALCLPPESREVAVAAFIAACLCYEGYLKLDTSSTDSRVDYGNAIRLIAACLVHLEAPAGDMSVLPFRW